MSSSKHDRDVKTVKNMIESYLMSTPRASVTNEYESNGFYVCDLKTENSVCEYDVQIVCENSWMRFTTPVSPTITPLMNEKKEQLDQECEQKLEKLLNNNKSEKAKKDFLETQKKRIQIEVDEKDFFKFFLSKNLKLRGASLGLEESESAIILKTQAPIRKDSSESQEFLFRMATIDRVHRYIFKEAQEFLETF